MHAGEEHASFEKSARVTNPTGLPPEERNRCCRYSVQLLPLKASWAFHRQPQEYGLQCSPHPLRVQFWARRRRRTASTQKTVLRCCIDPVAHEESIANNIHVSGDVEHGIRCNTTLFGRKHWPDGQSRWTAHHWNLLLLQYALSHRSYVLVLTPWIIFTPELPRLRS